MSWIIKNYIKETRENETGAQVYPPGLRHPVAFIYPNVYHLGMSNLGMHILYQMINERGDSACERFFLPDKRLQKEHIKSKTPLLSLENQRPLADFDVIFVMLSFEMDYDNLLTVLDLGTIRLRAAERNQREPLVIIGGPCATFNPEPMAAVADAFVIGEGEETVQHVLDTIYREESKQERLAALAQVPGVYVPSLYTAQYDDEGEFTALLPQEGAPAKVARQWARDIDAYPHTSAIVTSGTEFEDMFIVEVARGCGRHCRFCMAGYCFRKPRNRSLSVINEEVQEALKYRKRIGLMGAAISDYPEIDALCKDILGEGLSMSVASFRADSVTKELVDSLAESGLKTLTMAPEAGSDRMRAVINKGIEEHHLFHSMDLGLSAGIRNFRLYIMVGLPFEEEEDIDAIIDLAERLKDYMEARGSKGTLTLSVNPFIPKPFTPFQWEPMADRKTVEKRLKRLEKTLRRRKHVVVNIESPKEAYIQGVLSRGDRRVGEALMRAHELGGSKAFKRALRLDPAFYLYRKRPESEVFPWERLDMGFKKSYLYEELKRAEALKPTIPCFEGCHRCGVC